MIKKIFLIYILSLNLFAQKITIYSGCNYKPYSYCEDGKVKGISVDIFKSIFAKLKDYSIEVKGIDLKKARQKMKDREILMLGTMSYRKKRLSYIYYTKPYIYHNRALYCNKKYKKNLKWPENFYGLKIARAKGHSMNSDLKNAVESGHIKMVEGKDSLIKLIENRVDCYIDDNIAIKGEMLKIKKEYKDANMSLDKLDKITKIISFAKSAYYIGFSKANFPARKDLIKKINLAIKIMQNSHEIEEITKKHLKLYLHPEKKRTIDVGLYNLRDKLVSDELDGYGVIAEIVSKAFEVENIAVNYQFHNYNYDYLLTKWSKICMSVPWLDIGDRERYFYFSNNIKPTAMYFFYNTKFHARGSIKNDFELYRIGGIKGYFYEKKIFNEKKATVQYTSFKNWKELIEALLSNKIDVIFARKSTFYTHLKCFLESKKKLLVANKNPLIEQESYAIFSKKCENAKELRDKFNKGLEKIKKRGIFAKILKKYNMTIDEFNGLKYNKIEFKIIGY